MFFRSFFEPLRVRRQALARRIAEGWTAVKFALAARLEKMPLGQGGARLVALLRAKGGGGRINTPTVLQMESVECGAACLTIVLAYYGRWVSLEEMRSACGVSRDGSKASNIVRAAMSYGLGLGSFRADMGKLRELKPPLILHWNFNHFVVFEGFKGRNKARINDPATGPRTVLLDEMDRSFTGVALGFKPGENFVPGGTPPRLGQALGRRLRGHREGVLFVTLVSLALAVPLLVAPAFTRVFVDMVLVRGYADWLPPVLAGLGLLAAPLVALHWLQQRQLLRLENKIAIAESSRFLRHVLRLPMDFFAQRFAGDLAQRIAINNRVAQLLSRDLASNALDLVLILFFGALMLTYDVPLTLLGLAIVTLNVLALRWVQRQRVDANRQLQVEQGKVQGLLTSGLQLIESIKATAAESDFFAWFAGQQAKIVNIRQRLERYTQALDAVPPLLTSLAVTAILGFGSLRIIDGELTVGQLVAFQILMFGFVGPVERLVNLGGKLQVLEGDLSRLDDVLRHPAEDGAGAAALPGAEASSRLAGRVRLRGVSFGYSRLDPPLIKDFDLDLEPGSRVALVGASGSGKSTVARLVTGLYEPWEGEITFDGKPPHAVPVEVRRHSIASVDQEIFLFRGSVRENLSLWDPHLPLADITQAARDAEIHDEIELRPGGYDGPVLEGGGNWSGGQRQRLEIARALSRRPSILVLDEATSALDPITEERIDQNLRRRGATCLIIAHRLSTIRDADTIVVLDKGEVVQRGTHEELVADGQGLYATLVQSADGTPADEHAEDEAGLDTEASA